MGNPSHSALCSRCILCNVQSSISLAYNTLDNTCSTCLIRKVQQTHEPRVGHFFTNQCKVPGPDGGSGLQCIILNIFDTFYAQQYTFNMLNVQRTANALEPRVRHCTTDKCNVQSSTSSPYISLNNTFNKTRSIRNVQQTHLESERSRQGTHFITDECTHRRQQQLIDICWNQAL